MGHVNVYPTTGVLPLVETTRWRTQELFQGLLNRHGIKSKIEVKAFHLTSNLENLRYVDASTRWKPGLDLGFSYWINGEWDSSSWPSCRHVSDDDRITEDDLNSPFDSKPEHLGQWAIVEELEGLLPPHRLTQVLTQDHYWFEYRNAGGPAVASTGYGLVAAALAEASDGIIASFDCAFEGHHNGECATDFLSWWGDRQVLFYGPASFA